MPPTRTQISPGHTLSADHILNTSREILARCYKAPTLRRIELDTLLRELWTSRTACISEHDTVVALAERICESPADTLIGVDSRKEQTAYSILLQEVLAVRASTPHTTHAVFVNPNVWVVRQVETRSIQGVERRICLLYTSPSPRDS